LAAHLLLVAAYLVAAALAAAQPAGKRPSRWARCPKGQRTENCSSCCPMTARGRSSMRPSYSWTTCSGVN